MEHSDAFLKIVQSAKSRIKEISVHSAQKKLDVGELVHFIDIREDHEWLKDHAKGAVHLGKGIIERDIEQHVTNHQDEIILYCGGGYRSALAADALQNMGYTNVSSMEGGYKAWIAAGCPTSPSKS